MVAVVVKTFKTQNHMCLFNIALFNIKAAGILLRLYRKRNVRLQAAQALPAHFDEFFVFKIADRADDDVFGCIVGFQIILQSLSVEGTNLFGRSENASAQRLVRKGFPLKIVKNNVVRGVNCLFDFLHDHFALLNQLFFGKGRIEDKVADDVQRQFCVVFQHFGVKGRKLARRIGVVLSADILDFFRDLQRSAVFCALKDHMFQKVGNAVNLFVFIGGTCFNPDAQRNGFGVWAGAGNNS